MILPPFVPWSGNAADFQSYLDQIYNIFIVDFIQRKPMFLNKPIRARYNPAHGNKHFSFWHLISEAGETDNEDDRIPDLERCKRMSWVGHILSNFSDPEILCWTNKRQGKRGGENRYLLYAPKERYLIVLSEKKDCFLLVTAYCVEHENRHQRLMKEYSKSVDPRS